MKVIRPIRVEDLESLERMARASMGGIVTLPCDQELLRERIENSLYAFSAHRHRPEGESYLFILEDLKTGESIGCSGLRSKTGGYEPLFLYELRELPIRSWSLGIAGEIAQLKLRRMFAGPTEISTLFLFPHYRGKHLGTLLSLSRFLFINLHRNRFEPRVQASLRGVLTPEGDSPFYQAVCQPFFQIDYAEANRLRYRDPRFILEVGPPTPLYLPLLPPSVQQLIGKTHPHTDAALKLLKQQGFTFRNQIDIFDGGPYYDCRVDEIRVIRQMETKIATRCQKPLPQQPTHLIANTRLDGYRACMAAAQVEEGEAFMEQEVMEALQVAEGDEIALVSLEEA